MEQIQYSKNKKLLLQVISYITCNRFLLENAHYEFVHLNITNKENGYNYGIEKKHLHVN